jgi:hypothetical protein
MRDMTPQTTDTTNTQIKRNNPRGDLPIGYIKVYMNEDDKINKIQIITSCVVIDEHG